MTKIKNNISEILIIIGVLLLLYNSSDPVIHPDSLRYIKGSLLDPPLYSKMIALTQFIFNNLYSIIILQTLCVGFSIIYFARTLSNCLNLDIVIRIIISISLFLPIIQFYSNLLTETLSYAFSLMFVSFVIRLIYNFSISNLIYSIIFAITLLLIRNQFIYIYLVILLLYSGIFIIHRSKKILTFLIAGFFSILIIHNSLIFINTFLNKDSVNLDYGQKLESDWKDSLTYVTLGPSYFTYIDAIYISDTEDANLFENQNIKKTLTKIFNEMNNRNSLVKYYDGRGHFGLSLIDIRDYSNPLLLDLADKENTTISKLKKEVSIILISKNYRKYIKQIFKKFYDSTWLFVFIPFFMSVASFIVFLKSKSKISLLTLFISIFALANHSVVYLFGRVQPRYLIYSDFILLVYIFAILIIFLQFRKE